jgi:hypothetical protein
MKNSGSILSKTTTWTSSSVSIRPTPALLPARRRSPGTRARREWGPRLIRSSMSRMARAMWWTEIERLDPDWITRPDGWRIEAGVAAVQRSG